MEIVTDYLQQFGHLNQQQIALIHSKLRLRSLAKNTYFSEAGQIAREMAFITKGIMRFCFYNNKGEEATQYFFSENTFVGDIDSYLYRGFSMGYVQAVTDCELYILNIDDFDELSATIMNWDMIFQKIISKVLLDKMRKLRPLMAEDATNRYQYFLDTFPELANRVPQTMIASFLGITPSSLSRIRRQH